MHTLDELRKIRNEKNFQFFNKWTKEFFRREYLRDHDRLSEYSVNPMFGEAMREEVAYWNPNRSKHAEVYWLENYVFNQDTSLRNKILNAMAVKFVGMPTLTLVATDSSDYSNIIDFDQYNEDDNYYNFINNNLDSNPRKLKVWGTTQLQTSLQTAARNNARLIQNDPNLPFALSHMIIWINTLDQLGLSSVVANRNNNLSDVCEWLLNFHGIGPYFGYHPPCNFSRSEQLPNIDEDDNYCLVGPGASAGLSYVFPDLKLSSNKPKEELILSIRDHQKDFFEFDNDEERFFSENNLERGGKLTTFGTEILFCQFNCYLSIKDNPKAQLKRIVPLTFDHFEKIAKSTKQNSLKKLWI